MDQPLYEKIADQVELQIKEGVFLPGTKIPSVRKSSKQMSVSVATVLQAYSLLEDRGVVKARPQKGYFVQDNLPQTETKPQFEPARAQESVPELIRALLHASQRPDIIQFGAAIPHTQFLPIRQLQKSVGRLMRLEPEICAAYEFTPGSLNLRRQIAIRMLDAGCKVQPDDITITLGCQNAMILALRAITEPGDTIIIETPTYHGLLQAVDELKLKAIEIPCDTETGIDLDALTQRAIANFLENGAYDRHLRKTRHTYEENLRRCQQSIKKYFPEGTYTSDPKGGFLLWITLPPEINALTLHKTALEQGIGTIPGLAFSLTHSFNHHLRINYAISWDNRIDSALRLLGKIAKKQNL